MLKAGLVSISFRKLSVENIIEIVHTSKLDAIEWGGDIHVPHGDIKCAEYVRSLCDKNNILCPSYGSYYRVGDYDDYEKVFNGVIKCAKILGSTIIRVWAGSLPTKESDENHFKEIVDELKLICRKSNNENIGIALEFHANTLTDNALDTKRLLEAVEEKNLTTYWQPPVGRSSEDNLTDIDLLKDNISNIHTFTWKEKQRLELRKGYSNWVKYLEKLNTRQIRYCLLEFVKDDSIESFYKDALTLRTLVNLF